MHPKLKFVFAILIIIVGIAGVFLPIIPGIVLIIFGIYLINPRWFREKFKGWKIRWQSFRKRRAERKSSKKKPN